MFVKAKYTSREKLKGYISRYYQILRCSCESLAQNTNCVILWYCTCLGESYIAGYFFFLYKQQVHRFRCRNLKLPKSMFSGGDMTKNLYIASVEKKGSKTTTLQCLVRLLPEKWVSQIAIFFQAISYNKWSFKQQHNEPDLNAWR